MPEYEILTEENMKTIVIKGCLDSLTAPGFADKIKGELGGITMLILDLKELKYVSSAGLRELLELQNIMDDQGEMVIKNISPLIMDVFEVSGFTKIMNIEVNQ